MNERPIRFLAVAVIWIGFLAVIAALILQARDQHIIIAAGPRTSESFALASSIARVIERNRPSFSVEVFETQGSSENVHLLQLGQADFATVQADVITDGSVHAVASLYFDAYQLVVQNDSDIREPADLAGHRIAIGPARSGQNRSFWFVADHYDISPEDITALPMSTDAANFAMTQGQVDAVFRVRAVGNEAIRELVHDSGMRLVAIDQAAALSLHRPAIKSGYISRGSYRGNPALPGEDLSTAVIERFLVARADLDAGIVNTFTRTLFEQRSRLVAENNLAGFISSPDIDGKLSLAVHSGAQRYYDREKPSFWRQNTRILAPSLYVVAIVTSTLFGLRARIQRRHKVRVGDYNLELMDIADEVGRALDSASLQTLRLRLVDMLRGVVQDLDQDRVSQDDFEHFSFTWGAVDKMVRDRLLLIGEDKKEPQQ